MAKKREVFKFGGTSVGSPEAIRQAVTHVERDKPAVVIVSAMRGVTDLLLGVARDAYGGHRQRAMAAIEELVQRHVNLLRHLIASRARIERVEQSVEETAAQLQIGSASC